MYTNLQNLLSMKRISTKDVAKILGVADKTAYNKVNGNVDFYLSEAKKIMLIFPEYSMGYVFREDGDTEAESAAEDSAAAGV